MGSRCPVEQGGSERGYRTSAGVVRDCDALGRGVLVLGVQCSFGFAGKEGGVGAWGEGLQLGLPSGEFLKQGVRKDRPSMGHARTSTGFEQKWIDR